MTELMVQCFCNAMAEDSGGVYLGPQRSCGNSNLADRRDCLLNPLGPDDAPRPGCALMLEEDNAFWSAPRGGEAICQVLSCPSGMESLEDEDGTCACFEELPPEQDPADHCDAVLCPSGHSAVRMPDGSCQCNVNDGGGGYDLGGGFDLPDTPIDPGDFPSPFPGPFPGL